MSIQSNYTLCYHHHLLVSSTFPFAFIFDLDGVVIHSTPMHNLAWETYLEPYGIPREQVQTRMHGLRNDEIVRGFFGTELDPAQVLAHGAAKEALFRKMMAPQLDQHIVPGVRRFLELHAKAPIGLASNAERANIDFVLDGVGIRHYFQAVVDGHQAKRPKPFPDIYRMAADLLGRHSRDCVIFEDSPAGVQAARDSGAHVVGLTTTLAELTGVDLIIDNFDDPRLQTWLWQLEPSR